MRQNQNLRSGEIDKLRGASAKQPWRSVPISWAGVRVDPISQRVASCEAGLRFGSNGSKTLAERRRTRHRFSGTWPRINWIVPCLMKYCAAPASLALNLPAMCRCTTAPERTKKLTFRNGDGTEQFVPAGLLIIGVATILARKQGWWKCHGPTAAAWSR